MIAVGKLVVGVGVLWQAVRPGVWQREMQMAGSGPLAVVRVVAVRLDPKQLHFTLDTATRRDGSRGAWSIDRIPPRGVVAFNAGQFMAGSPWGWLVHDGSEVQPPGSGTLGMAFVVDSTGAASLVEPLERPAVRGHVRLAFQSYPALLVGAGTLPWELQAPGRGVDLKHRDSRLAIGILADGSIVVALTRYTGLGSAGDRLPIGPTILEMATFMRSLGCVRAMLLDGGISSQLAVRKTNGAVSSWSNWRAVPLGLIIMPRERESPRVAKVGGTSR